MKWKATKKKPAKPKRQRRAKKLKQPAEQAVGVSPLTGIAPPAEFQFQPGQSGNPAGRPRAGATLREWMNVLGERRLTVTQMRKVARDPKADVLKRAAAERLLRMTESGDLADMEPLLDGKITLEGLRKKGINTEIIKRIKVRRKTLYDDKEAVGEEVEREVELHDRAADDFDRVVDHTDGKAIQAFRDASPPKTSMSDDELREACQRLGVPMPPGLQRNDDPQPDPAPKP